MHEVGVKAGRDVIQLADELLGIPLCAQPALRVRVPQDFSEVYSIESEDAGLSERL
eukprot:CAMPEP_0170634900 /NCGR_PEP_ID=MMETSP0224-20130122/36900_1 /TAXON_ID=285029 /ORGANISM="Togula jolla, Strain CCCM 725" /LENGTH=55 /DNA_ID=CAMNT_0010964295 /DNA_START=213 /DNA_END=377 /DNA_ORIENTATION=+